MPVRSRNNVCDNTNSEWSLGVAAKKYGALGPPTNWSTSGDADDRLTEEVAFYYTSIE